MNRSYAKLVNGELVYAPDHIVTSSGAVILNPKRLSYLQAGYKPIVLTPPASDPPSGHTWSISRYTETADAIVAVYKPVPVYAPPRTFSKLKIVAALTDLNLWPAVHDWLVEADHYDLFVAAQSFREDHPAFTAALYAAQERFCLTDPEIEDLLSQCVADE